MWSKRPSIFRRRRNLLGQTFEVTGITLNNQPFNWNSYRG